MNAWMIWLAAASTLLRLQGMLPANPQAMSAMSPDAAFNTAISFVTNTNWQNYGGESTLGYLAQMLGLTVQNFLSAATGIAVVMALIRGFKRHSAQTIGNFWVDLTRTPLYILASLAVVFALVFVSQGAIQNFQPYQDVPTLQTTTYQTADKQTVAVDKQKLPMGPVASQEAIKMLGTNGGDFFNGNSAHPYENPTPLSNLAQMLAMLIIPTALCVVFGRTIGDKRQGYAVLAAMTIAFAAACIGEISAEQAGNPLFASLHVDTQVSALQAGGNMEGKETRFGIAQSGLFTVATTAASCGAVNTMHD
ncbi:Potassium-transporting ATPase A chain [Candidatus Burkholderia humilis]|nr:Potassium-transporting ATPase A chain [Candidatus Burkholderia humilis]